MANQLSALDLDAELREAQDNGYTPTAQMIVYLIQRVREAEAEWRILEDEVARLRAWEGRHAEIQTRYESYRADTLGRIAQLERVREAAQELLDVTAGFEPVREEHQVLGTALDELRITENPASHKAGSADQ